MTGKQCAGSKALKSNSAVPLELTGLWFQFLINEASFREGPPSINGWKSQTCEAKITDLNKRHLRAAFKSLTVHMFRVWSQNRSNADTYKKLCTCKTTWTPNQNERLSQSGPVSNVTRRFLHQPMRSCDRELEAIYRLRKMRRG